MKTKASIQAKWEKKINEMKKNAEYKYGKELEKKQEQWKKDFEYLTIKVNKKRDAYIAKKEKEYHRRMLNEIRELEGKEVKPLPKKKLNLLEFAMDIQQENSKLRDTDADGNGYCVSCGRWCSWENLHGGHDHSRKVKNICLSPFNINAQCKACNLATGPLGNVDLKEKTQAFYATTIELRWGTNILDWLNQRKAEYYTAGYRCDGDYGQPRDENGEVIPLNKYIDLLIKQNKTLRSEKNFYKPKQNWEKTWEKYPELHYKGTD